MRLSDEFIAKVDTWAEKQDDHPGRTEAMRRLVELGLKVKAPARPVSKAARSARAAELAAAQIEKMIDPSAPPEERAQRRRRLTKGPPEFREDRVDLPKAKK
jgi:alkanesulfonate monooxygenase SsuD/methylene tetrahydromethanopterin reductase-like flavin-dependent oxidoreductase (luciferase family)